MGLRCPSGHGGLGAERRSRHGPDAVGPGHGPMVDLREPQIRIGQVGTGELRPPEIGSAEVGAAQIGIPQIGAAQVGVVKVGTVEIGRSQVGSTEFGLPEIGHHEILAGAACGRFDHASAGGLARRVGDYRCSEEKQQECPRQMFVPGTSVPLAGPFSPQNRHAVKLVVNICFRVTRGG
jgi:hypothetical protein